MSLPSFGFDGDYATTIISASALVILAVHVVPYIVDTHGIRSIPGPWLARFTDAWLGRVAARGHRSEVVHEIHKQYGESISPVIPKSRPVLYTWLRANPLTRDLCTPRAKSRVNRRPRCPPNRLRPWKRKFEERFLRCICLHP